MKWKKLPAVPRLTQESVSVLGNERWLTVLVSHKYKIRRTIVTRGATNGAIEADMWTCDYLRGAEFTSYDDLRAACAARKDSQ